MKIDSYGISNVGMKRYQNEDAYLLNDTLGLYMVADGMGGHLGGEYASRLAVTTIEEVICALRCDPDATRLDGEETGPEGQLKYAVKEAGRKIYAAAQTQEALKGMGTTAVVAFWVEPYIYVAHVGDSRAYFMRRGLLEQITEDHSLVGEQLKAGMISKQDAKEHRLKNIITRSVGYQEEVEVDVLRRKFEPGDKILLCSDGLSNQVDDAQIREILDGCDLREACEKLVNAANMHGGDDNITVVLAQLDDIP